MPMCINDLAPALWNQSKKTIECHMKITHKYFGFYLLTMWANEAAPNLQLHSPFSLRNDWVTNLLFINLQEPVLLRDSLQSPFWRKQPHCQADQWKNPHLASPEKAAGLVFPFSFLHRAYGRLIKNVHKCTGYWEHKMENKFNCFITKVRGRECPQEDF